mgnify:CR=1 FL=1
MEKVRSASQLRQAEAAKDARRKLNKDKNALPSWTPSSKSSMNPLLSDASPMNALTVCWRITKPSRKRCKFLSQKRKKGCPLSQRTVPVWSSFWSWQGSIPIFLS